MGPIVKRHFPFVVTDDGIPSHRYSVRCEMADDTFKYITGGASLRNSSMVAEALKRANAGYKSSILTEGENFE